MITLNPQSCAPTPPVRPAEVIINECPVHLQDHTPTGHQLLLAAGLQPDTEYALLLWPSNGPTREIGLEEVIPLSHHVQPLEFFAIKADSIQYFFWTACDTPGPARSPMRLCERSAGSQPIRISCLSAVTSLIRC